MFVFPAISRGGDRTPVAYLEPIIGVITPVTHV